MKIQKYIYIGHKSTLHLDA